VLKASAIRPAEGSLRFTIQNGHSKTLNHGNYGGMKSYCTQAGSANARNQVELLNTMLINGRTSPDVRSKVFNDSTNLVALLYEPSSLAKLRPSNESIPA